MERRIRPLLASLIAAAVVLAPTAASASDQNVAYAVNETDGAIVSDTSVQYRKAANGVVDEENLAYALARCTDCTTFAAAFQLVIVTKDWHTFVPHNEAFVGNVLCDECVTIGVAKQVIVEVGGPASLSEAGHGRMKALGRQLEAIEEALPGLSIGALVTEVNAAFAELLDIAQTEVVRDDTGENDATVVATLSS